MSADMLGLQAAIDECTCGSGLQGAACCYSGVPQAQGPLWAQYHDCRCSNPRDPLTNPDVSSAHPLKASRPAMQMMHLHCPD